MASIKKASESSDLHTNLPMTTAILIHYPLPDMTKLAHRQSSYGF